jgi:hypothetical protein
VEEETNGPQTFDRRAVKTDPAVLRELSERILEAAGGTGAE